MKIASTSGESDAGAWTIKGKYEPDNDEKGDGDQ
jgi:hypothetical protein